MQSKSSERQGVAVLLMPPTASPGHLLVETTMSMAIGLSENFALNLFNTASG
jgi:hypothetical protein